MSESKELATNAPSTDEAATKAPATDEPATKAVALATKPATDREILRGFPDRIAKSPTQVERGQVVLLDRHGVAMSRRRYDRLVLGMRIGIYSGLFGGAVLAISGAWLAGAAVYLAAASPIWWNQYRGIGKLLAIEALVRQGQLDEGQRRFDALPELQRRNRGGYASLAGRLASHRGDHEAALRWWRQALPRKKGIAAELLKISIVKALALSGQVKEAKLTLETVKLPLETDEVVTGYLLARVIIALHDAASVPQGDELHDWARTALAYSHTGVELAAIGWLFERAGDDDMVRLLATEAVDRMHYPYLATWWPALQQWLDNHKASGDDEVLAPE